MLQERFTSEVVTFSDPHVFGPPGSRSFYQQAKKIRKSSIPTVLWLLLDFLSLKNDVNVPSKSKKQKNFFKQISFLLASWRSMTKIAGSGSGSSSQRQGSADPDPDPHQNVMDPEHCFQLTIFTPIESLRKDFGLKLNLFSIIYHFYTIVKTYFHDIR
jgi:hypothetical protein